MKQISKLPVKAKKLLGLLKSKLQQREAKQFEI